MLAKTWHIENENLEARERIKEEDKKYKVKEITKEEKKTGAGKDKISAMAEKHKTSNDNAKKILGLMTLGIAEDVAKGIILGNK